MLAEDNREGWVVVNWKNSLNKEGKIMYYLLPILKTVNQCKRKEYFINLIVIPNFNDMVHNTGFNIYRS